MANMLPSSVFRSVGHWLWRTRLAKWFVRNVAPLQWRPCKGIRSKEAYKACIAAIRGGDTLNSLSKPTFGCACTPGQWTHSAICVGFFYGFPMIAEMTGDGFDVVTLRSFMRHTREFIVTRGESVDFGYGCKMAAKAVTFRDVEYDKEFELGDNELSCSELPEAADFENRIIIEPSRLFDQLVITPQDVADATNAGIVFDSRDYT
jgi:hypothetical protein